MSDAPERIWAVPEYNCTVYMSGNSPITAQTGPFEHRLHGRATGYVRADLSDALLREAMEVLGKLHHAVCGETGFAHCVRDHSKTIYPWPALDVADHAALATLAKLRAHFDGEKE